jgi:hypothetical protein
VEGDRSGSTRRFLVRRWGVDTPVGFKSESTRSWSEVGVASRLRLGGAGEHVDSGSRDLVLGAVSHGSLRGIIDARVVWLRWVAVALVQVLESFSLSLVVRTLLMLIGVSCGLEINISWAVSYQGG